MSSQVFYKIEISFLSFVLCRNLCSYTRMHARTGPLLSDTINILLVKNSTRTWYIILNYSVENIFFSQFFFFCPNLKVFYQKSFFFVNIFICFYFVLTIITSHKCHIILFHSVIRVPFNSPISIRSYCAANEFNLNNRMIYIGRITFNTVVDRQHKLTKDPQIIASK